MQNRDFIGLGLFAVLLYLWWENRKRLTALESKQTQTQALVKTAEIDYYGAYQDAKLS